MIKRKGENDFLGAKIKRILDFGLADADIWAADFYDY